ncbi:MAG: hypothetical protein PHU12_00865 [Candidatus Aenigmarchaeota archaeon]|nr:hypothetical protein [Candidatus Aenigmarchaeota archaeon]
MDNSYLRQENVKEEDDNREYFKKGDCGHNVFLIAGEYHCFACEKDRTEKLAHA